MPTYEYLCAECRSVFELRRPMAEREAPAACPHCLSDETSRVMSTFAAFSGDHALASGGCGTCTPSPSACRSCGIR